MVTGFVFSKIYRVIPNVFPKATRGGCNAATKEELNLPKLYAIALSRFGLELGQFLQLTPIEFHYAITDSDKYKEMELKTLSDVSSEIIKAIYESMRVSSFISYKGNPHIKNQSKVRNPEDLIPFNWDKNKKEKEKESPDVMLQKMKLITKEINTNAKPR